MKPYKLFNLIKQAYYSVVGADNNPFPSGKYSASGRDNKFIRMSVYGICSNPPIKSHILILNGQGRESTKFGFVNDFFNRKKNLAEGEVVLFNTKTGSFVYLKSDGGIDISASGDINIDAPTVNITGDVNITGATVIDGEASVTGDVISDSAGTAISLTNHFHLGNLGFNTGAPVAGGGVPAPSTPPSTNTSGDIIDGSGINLSTHTHAYSWTDGPGSSTTGAPQ